MKWLIGIAAVMLIAHFFRKRMEKERGREERSMEKPRDEDSRKD